MHASPDLKLLEGIKNTPVEVVTFGLYVLHLGFDNGNSMSIVGPFRFASGDRISDAPVLEFPLRESNLMSLLGSRVESTECDSDGSLTLKFTTGDVLIVYANDPMYEAYDLLIDGHRITV